jgi:hypothetical protein
MMPLDPASALGGDESRMENQPLVKSIVDALTQFMKRSVSQLALGGGTDGAGCVIYILNE